MAREIHEVRRDNLRSLVQDKFDGNRSAFARAAGRDKNLINLMLTTNPELRRGMGEVQARSIEEAPQLPAGWMDVDRSAEAATGAVVGLATRSMGKRQPDEMIPDRLVVSERWLHSQLPSVRDPASLVLVHMADASMGERIPQGAVLVVDTTETAIGADGVYVFAVGDGALVRRIERRIDGTLLIKAGAEGYEPTVIDAKAESKLVVVGKVLSVVSHRRL